MSTSVFPQGLESYNNTTNGPLGTAAYQTWKGTGSYSYPVAVTSGNVRPLTNNDPTNAAIQKHGLPRPLKWQYRKGTNAKTVISLDPKDPNKYIEISRESNRSIASIGQLIDRPGQFSVKQNPIDENDNITAAQAECNTCDGVSLVASFSPEPFLTNNPLPVSTNAPFCCNEERKARQRVLPANTNLPKQYFTSIQQYHQNRCQTYDQRAFNFDATNDNIQGKPGSPLDQNNKYVANCYPDTAYNGQYELTQKLFAIMKAANVFVDTDIQSFYNNNTIATLPDLYTFIQTIKGNITLANTIYTNFINNPYIGLPASGSANSKGCKRVYYKPSNPQFANEGGVSSSTRILKLTVDTISSNVTSLRRLRGSSTKTINVGGQPYTPFIYKNKVAPLCQSNTYFHNLNLKKCSYKQENIMYKAFSKLGSVGLSTQITDVGYTNV
jgi:hypothetical protein